MRQEAGGRRQELGVPHESEKRYIKFLEYLDEKTIIPFNDLDIKRMKGNWEGFYQLRIGKIRVIFTVDLTSGNIEVYRIGFRGDIYQ